MKPLTWKQHCWKTIADEFSARRLAVPNNNEMARLLKELKFWEGHEQTSSKEDALEKFMKALKSIRQIKSPGYAIYLVMKLRENNDLCGMKRIGKKDFNCRPGKSVHKMRLELLR